MASRNKDPRLSGNLWRMLGERDMTIRELSLRSGIAQSSAYAYVNGTRVPDVTRLRCIRATLGCTWDELLGE